MHATLEQTTVPAPQALLKEGALTGEWALDSHASSIRVKAWHLWALAPVSGVFREVSGNATISPNGKVSGSVRMAAASFDTKNTRRDTHLRSKAFLASDTYPDITYTVEGVWPSGHGVTVTGALTLRDRTQALSFDAEVSVQANKEIWLDAEVPIDRTDFGLTWSMMGMPSTNIVLTIHAVFTPA